MTNTVLRKHYMLTMRLDLSCVNRVYLQSMAQRLQNFDIIVSTLGQEQDAHSDAVEKIYDCHNECRKQQPPIELRQEPIAFNRWITAAPELYIVAMYKQEYIGVCMFEQIAQSPESLVSGFTGVVPAWTGRGVAKALKAHGLLYAEQQKFRYIETSNLVVNRGMCAINKSLGFQVVKKHLQNLHDPCHRFTP